MIVNTIRHKSYRPVIEKGIAARAMRLIRTRATPPLRFGKEVGGVILLLGRFLSQRTAIVLMPSVESMRMSFVTRAIADLVSR